ncbi:amidohydrolase family protein [Dyadobacter sediminis]|uniref:Amidohydrolase n=1 Tax=Dyadobacter sediminis TaxID=1493691 RepID=A0A5R9KFX2_9BACT|nr:amidohydrolase family protein [Dyadobacter sediminis]TLU94966.1 amidohydrolase [Dyadobacter sediminis]GGB86470.1 organophopsphate acid anhydrase [Dyadobacter sediminis]
MKPSLLLTGLLVLLTSLLHTYAQQPDLYLLKNATIIDGTGTASKENQDILIRGERIEAVGNGIKADGAKEVSLKGKTVIPAIISAHAHIGTLKGTTSSAENYTRENIFRQLRKYQDYGVNSILVMGTDRPLIFNGLRDSTVAGLLPGARLFSAGYGFNTPDPSPGSWMNLLQRPATPEEVPAMMDKLVPLKPTVVKIWVDDHGGNAQKMKPEIYTAIIREAHKRNLRVAAHLFYAEDARALTEAGIDMIAHSIRDKVADEDLLAKMKQHHVTYIPTLSLDEYQFAYAGNPDWINDEFFKASLEPGVFEMITDKAYAEKIRNSPDYEKNMAAFKTASENLKKIFDAGITVALGTDSGAFPVRTQGFTEHLEMELMVRAGLTPLQAIMLATLNAAKALKIDPDYGSIQKGKKADLIILSDNPEKNIKNTRKIESVWKDGKEASKGPLKK